MEQLAARITEQALEFRCGLQQPSLVVQILNAEHQSTQQGYQALRALGTVDLIVRVHTGVYHRSGNGVRDRWVCLG